MKTLQLFPRARTWTTMIYAFTLIEVGRAEEYIANANVAPSNPGVRRDEDEEANVQHSNPDNTLARLDLEQD